MKLFIGSSLFAVFVLTYGSLEVDDSELDNYINGSSLDNVSRQAAVSHAAQWLLEQRQNDESGWGAFSPRAVVAIALAEEAYPLTLTEWELITKQLNIMLSLDLGKNVHRGRMGLGRLALYVNALYATCQDPHHFHGLDLVQMLRSDTDAEIRNTGDHFSLPAVFLTLCFAGKTTHGDLTRLGRMHHASGNKTDLQALQLLAISCMTAQPAFSSFRSNFESYLQNFADRLEYNTIDVYTKALALQAINSLPGAVRGREKLYSSLLSDQERDGSFERSLLATYQAIPALLGTSLLAIVDRKCGTKQSPGSFETSPLSYSGSTPKVHLSLWIGEGVEQDTHTVTVATGTNDTLFEVMRLAQEKNEIFKFSYDETSAGKRIYSLAGVPNDAEREVFWKLYIGRSSGSRRHEVTDGLDKIYPTPEDRIVFWFKRNTPDLSF